MMLLVIGGSVIGARLLDQTADATDRLTDRVLPAQTEAVRLQATLVNQETGVRGYAIAADKQFLTPYTKGQEAEARAVARLRDLVGDRPKLLRDLEAVEQQAAAWRRTFADPLVAGVTVGKPETIDKAVAERSRVAFNELRARWAVQNEDLARAVHDGKQRVEHERTVRTYILGALVVTFLLTAVVLTLLMRLLVARPLDALRDSSRRVARGDFQHVISGGGPKDLTAVAHDVEYMRQQLVAELEASQAQQEILTSQAADLDAQAVELRRSNAELEQFAYVASHDLQEPLRKVASFCQLLEKRYGEKLDERGLQYIDFAVDGAKRMQILINDLLTFSRVGRVNDARLPVDLDQALDRALANVETAVTETGARIERPAELPGIVGDPMLLAMLWQNLVGNAVKFRHPDRTPHVRITCERDPDHPDAWLIDVVDNGIGIPREFNEKVFVIFQRLHSRDSYGGTGIGLALCKKIVEYHGGRIWIDTDHLDGTRFRLTLPVAAEPADTSHDTPHDTEEKVRT
ncbi:ATP-binding protein [Streptomyces sp. NPDC087294]|uniref:sensor histidine kinase n=1 Tax=Streptomyces sp. NPDC087294 TaxID=3365777 RepID=UPI0037F7D727